MKSLILYSSQSGNTKKLAEAVRDTLPGDKAFFPVDEAPDASQYDIVWLGFWLQAGKPDPKSSQYLSTISTGKKVFLFATHGAASDSAHAAQAMQYAKGSLAPSVKVMGMFHCQGAVNLDFLAKVSAKPEPPGWVKDAPQAEGHPDENDIEQLQKRVKEIVGQF